MCKQLRLLALVGADLSAPTDIEVILRLILTFSRREKELFYLLRHFPIARDEARDLFNRLFDIGAKAHDALIAFFKQSVDVQGFLI